MSLLPRDEDPTFFSTDPDPAGKKNAELTPAPTFNRNEEKNVFIC